MLTTLDIAERIKALDTERADLEAALVAQTGKTYDEFIAGMARLLEPTGGYEPGSYGAQCVRAWRDQRGARIMTPWSSWHPDEVVLAHEHESLAQLADEQRQELSALRSEAERLRTALEKIADGKVPLGWYGEMIQAVQEFADEALNWGA